MPSGRKNKDENKISSSNQFAGRRKKTKKKKGALRFFKAILLTLLFIFIIAGAGTLALVYSYVKDIPDFNPGAFRPPVTSYIYDQHKQEIANLYDEENRIEISIEKLPDYVKNSFIAIEDERFYDHLGVDPTAIARAFLINLRQRKWTEQGGSTITQQLIKNTFLTSEKTLRRKIQEAWLALKMERQYSKSEILEMYLNQIYFAHGAYGIEAAADLFFQKNADELTLAEAALLAGIPRSPNYYSPFINFELSKQRQELVLSKMHDLGFINHREKQEALEQEIILAEPPSREYPYPHFIDYVLHHELVNILLTLPQYNTREQAYEAIYNMGLKVYTTLDTEIQEMVEGVLNDKSLYPQNLRVDMGLMKQLLNNQDYSGYPKEVLLEEGGVLQPQAAAVVANTQTGEVLALVGGRGYNKKDNQDLRFLSHRQPGSSIKPIASYAPAMEENLITPGSIIDDAPFIRGNWAPENFDRRFRGLVTVRESLVRSLNIPAIKNFERVTPAVGLRYAQQMGLSTIGADDHNLAASIGGLTNGVTAFDMAQAFAVLSNQGIKVDLHTVKKIEGRDGEIIYEYHRKPEAVLSPQTAYLITDILKDVVRRGTATRLRVGHPLAAKTGTTTNNRDAYLVAYTPDIVVSFWMGHDLPKLGVIQGGSGTTMPFMNAILSGVLKGKNPRDFTKPAGISGPISICNKSGLRPGKFCPPECIVSEIFPSSQVPQATCDLHIELNICSASGLLAGEGCPEEGIETGVFLRRPAFEVTDQRWRGSAGRRPEDAGSMPPTETCGLHGGSSPESTGLGFNGYLLDNPLRAHLSWEANPTIEEYLVYKQVEGEEKLIERLPGGINQYQDTDIQGDTVYTYKLVAVDFDGNKTPPAKITLKVPSGNDNQNNGTTENNGENNGDGDRNNHNGEDGNDENEEEGENKNKGGKSPPHKPPPHKGKRIPGDR
jgi:penicillin-binding protein 1A